MLLHQPWEACAFRPSWGTATVEGTLVLSDFDLRFESAQGSIAIPMHRLAAEVREGEETGEQLVFRDTAEPGLEIVTTEVVLLDCGLPPLQHAREAWVARLSRREVWRRMRILAWCAGGILVITFLASVSLSYMVRAIAARIPPEWDASYGAGLLETMRQDREFLQDSNAVTQIEALAEPLLRVLPATTKGYRFHLLQDDDPNAMALPGGHIVITSGMLALADAEELLGVLAHEMAHVTQHHVYRKQISTAGPLMIFSLFLGGRGDLSTVMGGGAVLLIGAGFSQEYEAEADHVGWAYLRAANVDPRGMIRLLGKLKEHEEQEAASHHALEAPQALHSHPATVKRIKQLEARWSKLRPQSGFIELPAMPKLTAPAP